MSILSLLEDILIFIFFFSFTAKIFSINDFYKSILQFNIIGYKFIIPFAVYILLSEVLIAICISLHLYLGFWLLYSCFLLIIFSAVLLFSYLKNKKVNCNCFGKSSKKTNVVSSLLRNILLIIISSLLFSFENQISGFSIQFPLVTKLFLIFSLGLVIQLYNEIKFALYLRKSLLNVHMIGKSVI